MKNALGEAKIEGMDENAGGGRKSGWWFVLLAVVAVALRLLLVLRGHNGDLITVHEIAALPWGTNFYRAIPYTANWGPLM